ncbi:hypothetical protein JKI95_09195 [Corynebacterium aquatimens]|uniref:hypothetical protein n=1 Tax=Corynebacterium aquatimens TaxID=1190508 RepID=UPI002541A67C|nr:hypothetical protein [Corynebacterium aquatimens]QYH19310.1 hypothetical protein JKI95_09195 [Corynebacterium aquatimens]
MNARNAAVPKLPNGANLTSTIDATLTTELSVALGEFFDAGIYDNNRLAKYLVQTGNLVTTIRERLLAADLDSFRRK